MKRYLVICGTGRVGAMLVDVLLDKALKVRATTRQKWRASERGPLAWAYMDLATGEGIEQAFANVDRAFLMVPKDIPQAHRVLAPLIAEAKRRRLEKVVVMISPEMDADARACERELARSGLRYDIVRPGLDVGPREIAAACARMLTRDDLATRERKPITAPRFQRAV